MGDSDDDLLAATPDDVEAFATFYRRHERDVLGYFARRTASPELAADLTAETFAAALLAAPRYRAGEAPASAWLFGIARHKLQRSFERGQVEAQARRKLSMQPLVLDDETVAAIERIGADVRAVALLETLPDDQAEAVRGRVVEEADYSELARRLRCSEAVVRQRVSRGLAALRRTIGEQS